MDSSRKVFSVQSMKRELPGLMNFYMSSHWTELGSGLLQTIKNGRDFLRLHVEEIIKIYYLGYKEGDIKWLII